MLKKVKAWSKTLAKLDPNNCPDFEKSKALKKEYAACENKIQSSHDLHLFIALCNLNGFEKRYMKVKKLNAGSSLLKFPLETLPKLGENLVDGLRRSLSEGI